MTPQQQERWRQIEALELQPAGSPLGLVDKVIQETGWTRSYAGGAIREYRRFLFLAAEAGHMVSPSPAVDEVWHLHLLYTRQYWDDLPRVLGFPLHHEPATGKAENREALDDAYARTLDSYARLFGHQAPAEYWPAKPRVIRFQRVDPSRSVVLPRSVGLALVTLLILALAALAAVLLWTLNTVP